MTLSGINKLEWTMSKLRNPKEGCPWDLKRDHFSLVPYLLEESHEFIEALEIHGAGSKEMIEELGDVLFQVVFHAELLKEKGLSDLNQIADLIAENLIYRHPHVFDPNHPKFENPEDVNKAWESLKKASKKAPENAPQGLERSERLRAVPRGLPSLLKAARVGEKAASFGFDWKKAEEVWDKVHEEMNELEAELSKPNSEAAAQEEFGDLLFALSQYARKRGWDPEKALNKATLKFVNRFEAMEKLIEDEGPELWNKLSVEEFEKRWQKIKLKK